MKFELNIRPLSVNKAWQGRRFKTPEYKRYCKDVRFLLMPVKAKVIGWCEIYYRFHLKYWKTTDGDNLVKSLTDIIINSGIIEDDRKILKYVIEKFPAKVDHIEVEIKSVNGYN